MATSINQPTSLPQATSTITPYPGYWYQTYTNYGERLYHMASYIRALNHPTNASSPSNPLNSLMLAPKT